MKNSSLWRISVATSAEAEEAVVELLETLFGQPASVYTDAESHATTASLYLESASNWSDRKRAQLTAGLRRIRQCGLKVDPGKIFVRRIRRRDWAESWKSHFKPMEIGASLLIKPSWSRRRPKRSQASLTIDPGLSFGTGQHPTTRFCLEQLVAWRRPGVKGSFLDIGTGSGILAIAAAKLGYSPVVAFDCDVTAIRIARANAKRNRVSGKVRMVRQDLTQVATVAKRGYDLICANLTSDLLLAEKQRILSRLKPGGRLVLAGILCSDFRAVRKAYELSGLKLVSRSAIREWASGAWVSQTGKM